MKFKGDRMLEKEEMQHLQKNWKVNMIIWGAIFASLPVYLIICKLLDKQQLVGQDPDLPMETIAIVLIVASIVTLFVTSLIRKKLIKVENSRVIVSDETGLSVPWVHQVTARYTAAMVISAALSESIGIYGLVVFLLSQNFVLFYQFLFLSAAGMLYYRPRKEELMDFASNVKKQQ